MEIQKIRYHPLVDANSEGTEKVPMFLTTDPKGVRSMYLEEMIPGYFRLYSKEPVSTGESDNSVRKNLQTVSENKRQAFRPVVSADSAEEGQISVFAQGLPAWDVVPPQIMVRRKMGR